MDQDTQKQLEQSLFEMDSKLVKLEDLLNNRGNSLYELLKEIDPIRLAFERPPYAPILSLNLASTQALCTRLASIYFRVLTDWTQKLELRDCQLLMLQRRFINQIFEASGFHGISALTNLFQRKAQALSGKKQLGHLANQGHLRYACVAPLSEMSTESLVQLSLAEDELTAVVCLGLLLDKSPLTVTGEANRKFLLEDFHPYEKLASNILYRHLVANVWMLASYSTGENKHAIKKHLNSWFERYLKSKNIAAKPNTTQQPGQKKTMVMAAESFKSKHAMYRWFSPVIRQMRQDYRMILIGLPDDVDEQAKSLFDEFIEVPAKELELQPLLNACQPDIVYFPSVGMRAWSIALANLRWGELQIMSLGHPASSFSKHIDLCLCGDRLFGEQEYFGENVLILDTEIGKNSANHDGIDLPEPAQLPDDVAHVAVPCHVMKLNFMFITALKEIERLSEKPIRYTFFPNESGVGHVAITNRLQSHFPNALVARQSNYETYLKTLNQHHLALSPFPFGNASSIIDCLLLNLPIVGLKGAEPHARSDYTVLGAFGLDEFLVADSIENYVLGAVRYLNESGLLGELTDLVTSKQIRDVQFSDSTERPDEIRRAIAWAWENKDTIRQQSGVTYRSEGRW